MKLWVSFAAFALTGAGAQTDAALAHAGRPEHRSSHQATRHDAPPGRHRSRRTKAGRPVTAPVVPPGPCPGADRAPDASNLAQVDAATICLVNKQRVARGLVALAANQDLFRAAQHHTLDMIGADYFDHVGPSGETPTRRGFSAGYLSPGSSYELGENIATASDGADTPKQIVAAWMHSAGHRANILNSKFRDTAVAAAAAVPARYSYGIRSGGGTYTQEFGATS